MQLPLRGNSISDEFSSKKMLMNCSNRMETLLHFRVNWSIVMHLSIMEELFSFKNIVVLDKMAKQEKETKLK